MTGLHVVPLHDTRASGWADQVHEDLATVGTSAASGILADDEVRELARFVDEAVEVDDAWIPADRWDHEHGRVVFLPTYGDRPLRLLEDDAIVGPCDRLMEPGSTLYTMTTSCNEAHSGGRPMHVDTHIDLGKPLVLGLLVLLDDFNEHTGSTRILPGVRSEAPSAEEFERDALRLEAPAGSVCWFDGRLYHDATANHSDHRRRCIILAMIRPFVRPRFDLAQMVGHLAPESFSAAIRQRLGFPLLPPGSYEDYYLPAAEREARLVEAGRHRSRREARRPAPLSVPGQAGDVTVTSTAAPR
ncbi:phytanoyl-CoA dioxygenase family protein [Aquihabitans daechungensis]|uniref:phytanoyl-CoA dioxygenase family protein n=1 Tax=Aquihabitans daechungensis TaxID=1052257 RepID=UPI003BA26233